MFLLLQTSPNPVRACQIRYPGVASSGSDAALRLAEGCCTLAAVVLSDSLVGWLAGPATAGGKKIISDQSLELRLYGQVFIYFTVH